MSPPSGSTRIQFYLTGADARAFVQLAERAGLSHSGLARSIVTAVLADDCAMHAREEKAAAIAACERGTAA